MALNSEVCGVKLAEVKAAVLAEAAKIPPGSLHSIPQSLEKKQRIRLRVQAPQGLPPSIRSCEPMSRPTKEVLYKETLGPPFGEKEHWFSVIFPHGDSPIFIEHEWSHHNPYNLERAVSGSGTTQMSVEDFLSGEYSQSCKDEFNRFINARLPGWFNA